MGARAIATSASEAMSSKALMTSAYIYPAQRKNFPKHYLSHQSRDAFFHRSSFPGYPDLIPCRSWLCPTLWPQLCISHYRGEETSAYIIERSLMRPRNMLKIFLHAKGFASNLSHQRIEETDLEKGVRAYSQDLLVELDHELTDVFPVAKDQ